jgi:hypothetical protein
LIDYYSCLDLDVEVDVADGNGEVVHAFVVHLLFLLFLDVGEGAFDVVLDG